MRKIVSFIILVLFTSSLISNYSYTYEPFRKHQDKLALMRALQTDKIADILFDDVHDIIRKYSNNRGWDLVEELDEVYANIQNSSDIIEYINIKPKDYEGFIELKIDIKRKSLL